MIKLPLPTVTHGESLESCLSEIPESKEDYKLRLDNAKSRLEAQSELYPDRASTLNLHEFEFSARAKIDALVPYCGDEVTKGDLVKLYKDIFSNQNKNSRAIYDRLKLSSKGRCCICLIGNAETLDHYLPKARYPAFSVDPQNLIPACTICNKGKGASLLQIKEEHVLHPYFSSNNFYADLWLKAEVIEEVPVRIKFFIEPPTGWNVDDITLLETHVNSFDITDKFSLYISSHLATAIDDVNLAINKNERSIEAVKEDFEFKADSRDNKNSPVTAMFRALSESTWFCSEPRCHIDQGFI
jgi:5-methylcytosine-specific restriction endonuclease McrA